MRSSSAETPSALRKCGSCKERKPAESSDAKAGRPSAGLRRKAQRTDRRTDDPAFRMKPETPRPGRNDESGGRSPPRRTLPRVPERTFSPGRPALFPKKAALSECSRYRPARRPHRKPRSGSRPRQEPPLFWLPHPQRERSRGPRHAAPRRPSSRKA